MEMHKAVVVLADIGGYTKFIKNHGVSLLHAERIITELLESVISTAEFPLTLNKLEGDAALFYGIADQDPPAAVRSAFLQAEGFVPAFRRKRDELAYNRICRCSACVEVGQLRVKAILHYGDVALKRVRQFEELAGETVIVAHRLLKNHATQPEYILVTEAFNRLLGGAPGRNGQAMVEDCEGIGQVPVVVYDPAPGAPLPLPPVSWPRKLVQLGRLQWHMLGKTLGMARPQEYKSLAGL